MDLLLNHQFPNDIKNEIISILGSSLKRLPPIALTCKDANKLLRNEQLWSQIYNNNRIRDTKQELTKNYYESYKEYISHYWQWDVNKSGEPLTIVSDRRLVIRDSYGITSNPCIQTLYPLTHTMNRFKVLITSLHVWISIGIAETSIYKENDAVVGCQTLCENVGIYQHEPECRLSANGSTVTRYRQRKTDTDSGIWNVNLKVGDVVEFRINFRNSQIRIKLNDKLVYVLEHDQLKNIVYYPTVSLSGGSSVQIIN